MDNPLDKLFHNRKDLDLEMLADLLIGRVALFIRGDQHVRFTAQTIKSETLKEKILIYILARKALYEKGIINSESTMIDAEFTQLVPSASYEDIIDQFEDLQREGWIENAHGSYYMPNSKVTELYEIRHGKK